MRAVAPAGGARTEADPIVRHPAVRRTLLRLQSLTLGLRVLAYWCAVQLDEAEHHPDAARRSRAARFCALLTPVLKAFATHQGFHGASAALQLWGGYGYVREYGIEQCMRDARIAMIYEGTNEIQAIDLLVRKVQGDAGASFAELLGELEREIGACEADAALALHAAALRAQCERAREALASTAATDEADPEWPLRAADDFLMGSGYLLLAWAWARTARAARRSHGDPLAARREMLARFGVEWVLPDAQPHWQRAARRSAALPRIDD